jgi:hypothetical protein
MKSPQLIAIHAHGIEIHWDIDRTIRTFCLQFRQAGRVCSLTMPK